ncbi:MAG: hypothetical protein DRJ21_00585 [Candidatus Methanomethylicota archaeon]|uniref:Uncharacterized protein n=1 Tax=Thermoproteota archaeon TaxID=2056631 RepID=A0A497EVG8_9CREN|nr:MAG: hypothetical protein DRJ21_00585 [Candidatus Verstraetearchaeota archaeon]
MKRIIKVLRKILLENAYCPYCKEYVRVETEIKRRNGIEIEIKKCIKCGRIVQQVIREKRS